MLAARNAFATIGGAGAALSSAIYSSTGSSQASGTAASLSWTDTVPAGACAVIWAHCITNSSGITAASATIGGTSATLQKNYSYASNAGFYGNLVCLTLLSPPAGSGKTISLTLTNSGAGVATVVYYQGVTSVGTATNASGNVGTQPSQATNSTNANNMYAQAIGYITSTTGATFSAYSGGTQRFFKAYASGINWPLIVGDASGNGGTLTLSATRSDTTASWGAVEIPLIH